MCLSKSEKVILGNSNAPRNEANRWFSIPFVSCKFIEFDFERAVSTLLNLVGLIDRPYDQVTPIPRLFQLQLRKTIDFNWTASHLEVTATIESNPAMILSTIQLGPTSNFSGELKILVENIPKPPSIRPLKRITMGKTIETIRNDRFQFPHSYWHHNLPHFFILFEKKRKKNIEILQFKRLNLAKVL